MFESSLKSPLVCRLFSHILLVLIISVANLFTLSFQITVFPLSSPLVCTCFISTEAFHSIGYKLSLILAIIFVYHSSTTLFLALQKRSLIGHAIRNHFFSLAIRLSLFPISIVRVHCLFDSEAILNQFAFSLEFSITALARIIGSIFEDKTALIIFSLSIFDVTVVVAGVTKLQQQSALAGGNIGQLLEIKLIGLDFDRNDLLRDYLQLLKLQQSSVGLACVHRMINVQINLIALLNYCILWLLVFNCLPYCYYLF